MNDKFILEESRKLLDLLDKITLDGVDWILEEKFIHMAVERGISVRPLSHLINAGVIKSYEPRATGRRYLSMKGDKELCPIKETK